MTSINYDTIAQKHPDDPAWQYETVSMLVAEKPAQGQCGD